LGGARIQECGGRTVGRFMSGHIVDAALASNDCLPNFSLSLRLCILSLQAGLPGAPVPGRPVNEIGGKGVMYSAELTNGGNQEYKG